VGSWAISAQDKYTVQVPKGLSFSEFRGYEAWRLACYLCSQEAGFVTGTDILIDGLRTAQ
jgi:hypothetical protein